MTYSICVCVCVCVIVCVSMFVCVFVCVCVCVCVCLPLMKNSICVCACVCACMCVHGCVCMYGREKVRTCVCVCVGAMLMTCSICAHTHGPHIWVESRITTNVNCVLGPWCWINGPYHMWMSRVTHKWVEFRHDTPRHSAWSMTLNQQTMSKVYESCHVYMSRVMPQHTSHTMLGPWSQINEPCQTCMSHVTCKWVGSHVETHLDCVLSPWLRIKLEF